MVSTSLRSVDMGIQLSTQLAHAMNHVNAGHRLRAFQLPEANGVLAGQLTPELIRSTARLTTKHICDLPAATQRGLQPPGAITAARPQHCQPLLGQTRETGKTDGFSRG